MFFNCLLSAISIDCPNVIQFAYDLGIPIKAPGVWTMLQTDCCVSTGITCTNQTVTKISWNTMGLNGFINGSALPRGVTDLTLARNQLTGSIPASLPKLQVLHLFSNQLSGELPLFPSTILYLRLGFPGYPGNRLSGTLRLNRPIQFYINDNLINDVVIQDTSQLTEFCDLSNNPLLGNPSIATLSICTSYGLYSVYATASSTFQAALFTSHEIVISSIVLLGTADTLIFVTPSHTISAMEWTHVITQIPTSSLIFGTFKPLQFALSVERVIDMVFKIFLNLVILVFVLWKTPWKRELKNKVKRWSNVKTKNNMLLTS